MPFVRRRPLLRAAAVGGVAYMGAKAGTNRAMQPTGWAAGPSRGPLRPPAPARWPRQPATTPSPDSTQLASLHDSGALTDEEFAAAKAQVLGLTRSADRMGVDGQQNQVAGPAGSLGLVQPGALEGPLDLLPGRIDPVEAADLGQLVRLEVFVDVEEVGDLEGQAGGSPSRS